MYGYELNKEFTILNSFKSSSESLRIRSRRQTASYTETRELVFT